MPANRLYDTWFLWVRKLLPDERITRVRALVWFIVGMSLSQSVHLSRIAVKLPFQVTLQATTKRLSRFLQNSALRVRAWYRPVARALLAQAAAHGPVRLIVDGSKVSAGTNCSSRASLTANVLCPLLGPGSKVPKDIVHLGVSESIVRPPEPCPSRSIERAWPWFGCNTR